jgi:uncharacterized membrane protein
MAKTRRNPSTAAAARGTPARSAPERSVADRHKPDTSDWLIAGLAALGMVITAYLSAVAWGDSAPALCIEGGGCDLIQRSQWSTLLGLPVALWGLATYGLLVLLALSPMTRLRRWQRCFTVALVGLAISLYLTLAGLIALQAMCPWCMVSLALIGAIFVLLCVRRPVSAPGTSWRNWLLNHGLLAAVVLVALHLYWAGMFSPRPEPRLVALATHLDATGAKFYGAFWCPTCREQKALFGGAADALPYVECSPGGRQATMAFDCVAAEVRSYPTWIIRGRRYEQVMHPDELASRSGFRWQPAEDGRAADRAGAATPSP